MAVRIAAVLLLLAAGPVSAHTVASLENGTFDNTIMPWAVDKDTLFAFDWTLAEDANGSAVSRSAEIGIDPATTARRTFIYECIRIDPARVYEAGVRVFIPPGQAEGQVVGRLAVRWFTNPECVGAHLTRFLPVDLVTETGVWTDARLTSLTAAPGATHVAFALEVSRTDTTGPPARVRFDDAYFVASANRLIVPAVGSLRGDAGSVWSSDLYLVNPTDAAAKATLLYRCFANASCNMRPRELVVPPRESMLIRDAVVQLLESPDSSGALEIFDDSLTRALVVTTRLNSQAPRGTFGAEIPALRETELSGASLFAGIRHGPAFRTNLGVYNPQSHPVTVMIALYVTGRVVAETTLSMQPRTLVQMNVFHALGVQTVTDNAWLRVTAPNGPVAPFVSVIDNATNDVAYSNGTRLH